MNQNSSGAANCLEATVYNQKQIPQRIAVPSVPFCMEYYVWKLTFVKLARQHMATHSKTWPKLEIWREDERGFLWFLWPGFWQAFSNEMARAGQLAPCSRIDPRKPGKFSVAARCDAGSMTISQKSCCMSWNQSWDRVITGQPAMRNFRTVSEETYASVPCNYTGGKM